MSSLLFVAGLTLAAFLAIPSAFFLFECAASRRRRRPETIPLRAPKVTVLVPAHDEERGITAMLTGLFASLDRGMQALVVADNCSDRTAEIAASLGVRVVERFEPTRLGKGYAIEHGVCSLAHDPPDVVVVLDADCLIDAFSLRRIADLAYQTQKPVQAEYSMEPSAASIVSRIGAFAFAVRNRVRPRGLKRLGVPVHLAGTGMAFPFALLRSAPRLDGHLAEDQLLGLELTLGGRAPILAEETMVRSRLPESSAASRSQRGRWEGGSLSLVRSHAPRVIREAIRYRQPRLLGLALDLTIPPLALLVLLSFLTLSILAAAVALGAPWPSIAIGAVPLGLVSGGVIVAWRDVGRALIPWQQLVCAPLYVLWKVPLYLSMVVRGMPTRWERTAREQNE